ncbi:glycosyltransferase [Flavobacterium sp. TMP13]|uniref:glycosyltransferase n=1 Tax=Flavobacterium sp. TMP13 TaxID=3425950 RepID=UPI003D77E321
MNIGIVTTWFERGASYVSKSFRDALILNNENDVFIFVRGGEQYAIGDKNWDYENVFWSKRRNIPSVGMVIDKDDFNNWIKENKIELVIFNEQHWFIPLLWCKELNVKTIAYIDYYTAETIPLFDIYDAVICNTKRHFTAFRNHKEVFYLPWGTQLDVFKPTNSDLVNSEVVTFFHSCGRDKNRKGADLILKVFDRINADFKLIIHTQVEFKEFEHLKLIKSLQEKNKLEIICNTVTAPGLFFLGDIYVYPSRLEGVGLTIAEALASGLGLVTTDMAPMNEFSNEKNSLLVNVLYQYSRADAYYWPMCEIDLDDLQNKLESLCHNKQKVVEMKMQARIYSEQFLDVKKNLTALNDIVGKVQFTVLEEKLKNKILSYEKKGLKKYSRFYLQFYCIYNFLRRIKRKLEK